ncbi:MAG: glycosyltransferase family 2 protein [Clostridia bacterium]|nr:glycosyltransferase family 2 protein [Clostridia bacterium]
MPLVSVIMNCYNSDKYLNEALDSLYKQTFKDFEIIFWDNQSTDKSAEIAMSYGKPLRYFKGETFLPLGAARNEALKKAEGKYIAFLDCDDRWAVDKLERQIELIERLPKEVGFVYSNYYELNMAHMEEVVAHKNPQPEGKVFGRFLNEYPVGMVTVLLRKSELDKVDTLFDENLNIAEEYDLFMRILYSCQAAYIHEPLAVYRIYPENTTNTKREKWPDEVIYVVNNLKSILSESDKQRYVHELKLMELMAKLERAKILRTKGDNSGARENIKFYIHLSKTSTIHNLRCLARYIETYMPYKLSGLIRNNINRFRRI